VALSVVFGVLASAVQFLGLIRWPFLVPYLARIAEDDERGSARHEAVDVVIGPLFVLSSVEFLGRFEPSGWKLAGQLTPVAYILWSLWLAAIGVVFLV
jgi:hypothetical protein